MEITAKNNSRKLYKKPQNILLNSELKRRILLKRRDLNWIKFGFDENYVRLHNVKWNAFKLVRESKGSDRTDGVVDASRQSVQSCQQSGWGGRGAEQGHGHGHQVDGDGL